MQPLISTHFFLQKLTIFLLLCGEYLRFFKKIFCCSVLCHHFLPFFSPFSLPNTSVACAQSITLRIFKGVKCLHLVNSFIHLSCQTIALHSVKRDCVHLLNVHWIRSLPLEFSIKNHLRSLHTLWKEIRSPCPHCDKMLCKNGSHYN